MLSIMTATTSAKVKLSATSGRSPPSSNLSKRRPLKVLKYRRRSSTACSRRSPTVTPVENPVRDFVFAHDLPNQELQTRSGQR
jgi:hypothetical protein